MRAHQKKLQKKAKPQKKALHTSTGPSIPWKLISGQLRQFNSTLQFRPGTVNLSQISAVKHAILTCSPTFSTYQKSNHQDVDDPDGCKQSPSHYCTRIQEVSRREIQQQRFFACVFPSFHSFAWKANKVWFEQLAHCLAYPRTRWVQVTKVRFYAAPNPLDMHCLEWMRR